jgi:hypothetical protein
VGVLPEPAVGVFTTAGTRQRRLRRHFVIGYAARDRTRLPSGPAAIGFGGGSGTGQGAASCRKQAGDGDEDQGAAEPAVIRDRRRHARLRARSAGQRREPTVIPGQPDTPTHLRIGRLTRCANRPSKQRVRPQ